MCAAQMSKKAFDELSSQLKTLKTTRRTEIAKAIEEAREQGDLKENAGYHYARQEQSLNEAKIKELESKLEGVEVVAKIKTSKDFVSIGSKVKFENLTNDRIVEYTLVSEAEADIMQRKISNETPLGEALMGAKVGEVLEYEAPAGTMKIKILEIS
jgi:transcription elongation factor GreA